MKNYLSYYYNIDVENIHQTNGTYTFDIDGYLYKFFPYYGNLDNLKNTFEFNNELLNYGIYNHRIIPNKDKAVSTNINGVEYVLIKYYHNFERKMDFNDIVLFQNVHLTNNKPRRDNWKTLWENKIDYLEYQISQFGEKNPLLRESFGYFSGYAELAISLFNAIDIKDKNLVLAHKRINADSNLYDLYDPFNLIIDFPIRDVAEYFKGAIVQKKNIISDIVNFFSIYKFEEYEYQLFFIRMLYPSFYFDAFEEVIDYNEDDKKIITILECIQLYEQTIKDLYILFGQFLPNIEWLKSI